MPLDVPAAARLARKAHPADMSALALVRNDDGIPAADGEARQWTVIPPVRTTIGILEQLTATSHLFPLRPHWLNGASRPPRRRPAAPGGSRGRRAAPAR